MRTKRHVNPLVPEYELPNFHTVSATEPKFMRDTLGIIIIVALITTVVITIVITIIILLVVNIIIVFLIILIKIY